MIDSHLGDVQHAIAELEKALSLNPYFHPIHAQEARSEIARLRGQAAIQKKIP